MKILHMEIDRCCNCPFFDLGTDDLPALCTHHKTYRQEIKLKDLFGTVFPKFCPLLDRELDPHLFEDVR
jgi:hypothetical protein